MRMVNTKTEYLYALFFISLVGLSAVAGSVAVEGLNSSSINIGSYTTYTGSNVTVPVEIRNATEIAGGFVNISFNPSIVNVQETIGGDFGTPVVCIDNTSGFVRIAASRATAVGEGDAKLASIRFRGISKGVTALNIANASVNYENGTVFIPETSNGMINVSTPPLMYIASYDVRVGSNVTVPIKITNATGIAGGSAKVVFNGSIVTVEDVTAGQISTNVTANIDNTSGYVHIAVANATAAGIPEAVLANITFKGLSEGSTALGIQNATLNDGYGNVIIPGTSDGRINVKEAPSPCFIATAAYGTPLHRDINILRKFRNEVLTTNAPGEALVEAYYSTSPPIANALAANSDLRALVRVFLLAPLVYFAGITLNGGLFALIIACLAGAIAISVYPTRKYGVFVGILKAFGFGALSIAVLTSLVFALGWLGYTYSVCAAIAAYILPLIIPISITVMLVAVFRQRYKNKALIIRG